MKTKCKYMLILIGVCTSLFSLEVNSPVINAEDTVSEETNIQPESDEKDWFEDDRSDYEKPLAEGKGEELPPPPDPPSNVDISKFKQEIESKENSDRDNVETNDEQSTNEDVSSDHSESSIEKADTSPTPKKTSSNQDETTTNPTKNEEKILNQRSSNKNTHVATQTSVGNTSGRKMQQWVSPRYALPFFVQFIEEATFLPYEVSSSLVYIVDVYTNVINLIL